jgi:hypothetical protein
VAVLDETGRVIQTIYAGCCCGLQVLEADLLVVATARKDDVDVYRLYRIDGSLPNASAIAVVELRVPVTPPFHWYRRH